MTEILLFNQYFTSKKESSEHILATLPINLLCLATYLRLKEIDCKIYELGIFNLADIKEENGRIRCGIADSDIKTIIKNENPKVIGLGCIYSRHYIDIISLSKHIKQANPAIKIVLGGNHATAFWDMILKEPTIDFVVRGEGEITFYELCEKVLSDKTDFINIDGLAYKDSNGNITKTPDRELIKNLDELPNIDYTLVDFRRYAYSLYKSPYHMRYPSIGIISSRGCPNKCVYCTVKAVWGRTWRAKSAKRTVDEIELLHTKYGIKEFSFMDDSASLDKKRWNEICDEIIRRGLDIKWNTPNGIAHWTLDKQSIRKMKASGCYRVTFGIESGNIETRKFLGKPYQLTQAKELIQYANKIGMWTICTNILGFPYETKTSMYDTIKFAKESGTDFAAFFLLSPHVTSDVYTYFKKEGLLDFDFIFKNNIFDEEKYEEMNRIINYGGVSTKYFTAKALQKIHSQACRSFIIYRAITYLNPLRLARKIRSFEDLKYTLRLVSTGFKILIRSFYKKSTKALLYD